MRIYLAKSGRKLGPFTSDEVQGQLIAGEITENSLAWHEGVNEWAPLKDIISLPPQLPPQEVPSEAAYYYIPVGRLVGMSLVTLSFYQVYWFYRNWRYVKESQGLDIMPFWRGVFSIFFIASLFTRIRKNATARALNLPAYPDGLAALWIIVRIGSNIGARLATDPFFTVVTLVVGLSTVFLLVPVQRYINQINEAATPQPSQAPWKVGHTITAVLGGIVWFFVLVGLGAMFVHPGKE